MLTFIFKSNHSYVIQVGGSHLNMSTCVNQLISVSNKLIFAAADSFNIQTTPLTVVRYNGKGWVLGEGCCDGHIFGHGDSLGSIAHKTGNLVLVAPAIHVVASVGGGDGFHLSAVVHAVGVVGQLDDAAAAFKRHRAPVLVLGEGEGGFGGEVGGEGGRGGAHGEGLLDGGVAVEGGLLIPVDEVVGLVGRGGDAQLGAGQDAVGVVGQLLDAGGNGADGAVDLNLGDAFISNLSAQVINIAATAFAVEIQRGRRGGDGVGVSVIEVEFVSGDVDAFCGREGYRPALAVTVLRHPYTPFVCRLSCEGDGGHVVEGLAAAGEAAAGVDGGEEGLRAGHQWHLHAAPLAVVAGEGEDGDFVEGGGEGGRGGGHGVAEGVAEAGVADDEGGQCAVVPLGEVAALGGRGGDIDLGAGQDAVGVLSLGGRYAVGGHGAGAGLAGDGPIVGSSPFKLARIIAAVVEGTADADSDRMVVLADFAHAFADLVVCIGIRDIGIIAEGGVVGHAAGGDGKSPVAFVGALMIEGDVVDGANALGNLKGAVAVGGEGEGVGVEDVDGEVGAVAQEVVVAVEDHVDGVAAGAVDVEAPHVVRVVEGDDAVHAAVAQAYGAAQEGIEEVLVHAGADAADDGQLEAAVGRQALGGHGGGVVGPCQVRLQVVGHVERGVIVGHGEVPRAVGVVRHRRRGVGRVAVDLDGGDADHMISVAVYMAVGGFDRDVVCAVT